MPDRKGLGRGLEVLLGGAAPVELTELPVDAIHSNPRQPRKRFDSDAASGLAESIRVQGVVQPILVRSRKAGGKASARPGITSKKVRSAIIGAMTARMPAS